MKLPALILITIAAFVTAAAFKSATNENSQKILPPTIAEQKQFTIRCSPLYIPEADESIPPLTGWGNYSWKITTTSDSTQFYFNQGINMYYAFHIIESRASFDKATRFDPSSAMAWWGKALAFGPNINDFGYQRPSEAYASALKASELTATTTPVEKALIEAMAVRYTDDTTKDQVELNMLYRDKMSSAYKLYNKDENVSALYADALMLLHPWDFYNHDYTAKKWTPEIIGVLQHTFQLNPKHPGANHYYIHAVEASAKPGDALKSADFLSTAMPHVSHLTHMPSHIYIRTGYYNKGINVNDKAVDGFNRYSQYFPATQENIALYDLHNEHMKVNCAQMAGNYGQAMKASKQLQEKIPSFYLQIPGALGNYVQYLHQSELFTQLRFGKWQAILEEKVDDSLSYTPVLQHFARGIAFTRTKQIPAAIGELEQMRTRMKNPVLKEPLTPFNSVYNAALVAEEILQGVIAQEQKDYKNAEIHFSKAVLAEDKLIYDEPRDWLLPARQYLGNALVEAGRYTEAIKVFNEDLFINPNNGWALTGLAASYKGLKQKKSFAAAQSRLKTAWIINDVAVENAVF
jgi:tetratricopeptide (TPR) repeat protein